MAVLLSENVYLYRPRGYTSPKGKKFQEIYSKFRSKCAHGIWTLVLLMFMRVLYNAWVTTDCITVDGDGLVSDNIFCSFDYYTNILFVELVLGWKYSVF